LIYFLYRTTYRTIIQVLYWQMSYRAQSPHGLLNRVKQFLK